MNDVTLKSSAVYKNDISISSIITKIVVFLEIKRFYLFYKLGAIYKVCNPISYFFCFYNDRMIQTYQ